MKTSLLSSLIMFVIGLALFLFSGGRSWLQIIGSVLMIAAGVTVLLGAMRSRKT